ncbi:Putative polygalacturonase [Glycine soja]|uniref:Putative polygalacturonase n=2 Tax=Glycine soja TaxID=3848 RepID=A0A0B2PZF6_GLYSO|nr:Putative polygalacturonase [Glycine soja]
MIEIMFSDQIQISNLTLVNSPSWFVHPIYSSNITIKGLTILAPVDSPNTDGIDPDSCTNTRIEDCYIVSGDDCVAVKSGWDEYGIKFGKPTQHLVIRRLTCISPDSAVIALGSEMSGGIQDVRVEDIIAISTQSTVRIKTAVGRGNNGLIDGQGAYWWNKFHQGQLTLTRPYLIETMYSDQIQISFLTLVNSPTWFAHVMESLKKSMPPSFLSKENCGNHKKNHCEVAHEQGFMELQLSNTPVSVYDSPGRISTSDPSEAYISPTSVEKAKQFVSMIDDCESSSTVYCKGISVRMKQNPPCPADFQIHRELESKSFSCSFDGESNSSFELCLPDEDSLITLDELFLMPDAENLVMFDSSVSSSAESNLIEADVFSPSSPREMVEKLVEFILNDEISTPHVDNPIVHHGAGLGRFSHSMHAQQTPLKFCSNQLNPERDPQDHNKFQRNSIDSAIYSFFSHPFPSNTFSQPFPLYHDELKRFDHEVSQSMLQQIINPGKLNLCSLQSGVTPHLPALQMASCTQAKSNADSSLCISGTKELWGFCKTKSRVIAASIQLKLIISLKRNCE